MPKKDISIKTKILRKFKKLDERELSEIEKWISSKRYKDDLQELKDLTKSEQALKNIATYLKMVYPLEHYKKNTYYLGTPPRSEASDNQLEQTDIDYYDHIFCMDEFLYDEAEVEELFKNKIMHEYYCCKCDSTNIQKYIFLSHSMSRKMLQYIFKVVLPSDLEGKVVMDVGSRIGAVIFAAYELTNAETILGIEINKELCEVQQKVIQRFSMNNERIKIIHSDIINQSDNIELSDIIIINVLDFFVSNEKHKELWYFFKKHIKKNTFVITNRSISDTLNGLEINSDFCDWCSVCSPFQLENKSMFGENEIKMEYLHFYKIN